MSEPWEIVSMMLCGPPVIVAGRAVVSASDSVWTPIERLPDDLDGITDDLGNKRPTYAGTVFVTSPSAIDYLQRHGILICMRGVRALDRASTDCPPGIKVDDFLPKPVLMGWDIVRGNGWVSASCDGCFPVDSNGEVRSGESASALNAYSLFDSLEDCLRYCDRSNKEVPEWAPWYPVAVYCDPQSRRTIDEVIFVAAKA